MIASSRGVYFCRVPLAYRNLCASPAAVEALSNYKGENYPFRVELDVQFSDLDCFKHVNNARYFTYFETARCKVSEQLGLPLLTSPRGDAGSDAEVGPVLAATSCVFKRQVSWPDRLCVGMRCTDLRRDRGQFTQHYALWSETGGYMAATGHADIVMMHLAGEKFGTRAAVPSSWLDVFFPGLITDG